MEEGTVRQSAPGDPISLRISVTDRCDLRCVYCTPAEGVAEFAFAETLRYEEMLRFARLVDRHFGLLKVHITGGEPLGRPGIATFVAMLADAGITDLAMTTNGQRLSEFAAELKRAGLKRINVSVDSLREDIFRRVTGTGELSRTLAGVEAALAAGLSPVKINTTVLRGINDGEVLDIARFGIDRGVPVRFIEIMPLGPAAERHHEWFVPSSEVLERLSERLDLQALPRGRMRSTREYLATDAAGGTGIVGMISSCSRPFCAGCTRLRLTAAGEVLGCLARGTGRDIRRLLRTDGALDEEAILEKIRLVLREKRTCDGFTSDRYMLKVGG